MLNNDTLSITIIFGTPSINVLCPLSFPLEMSMKDRK